MTEANQSGGEVPLPPVTTRWVKPPVASDQYPAPLAPPFVPGAPQEQPAEPMPVLRSFDSQPADDSPIEVVPQMTRQPDEPLMPWEEPAMNGNGNHPPHEHGTAGPVITAESDSNSTGLEEWESGLADGGQVVPAYGDAESAEDAAFSPPPQFDDEGAVMPQPERADKSFPLDAFIIPPDTKRLPKGLEHAEELHLEIAEELAKRLEAVAQRLRREGFAGLLHHEAGQQPIDTLLAGVLAGYLSNRADT